MAQNGNLFYREYGPWIPFPHPIDYPLANPTDEPYLMLKFNETWRPYIVGALSALARPETYAEYGTGFIKEDIDWGGQLPWLISEIPVPTFYNWYFIQDSGGSGDSANVVQRLLTAPGIDGFFGTEFIVLNPCAECENATQVTAIGRQSESPYTIGVGGQIASLYGFLLEAVIGNAWSVETTDCLDETVVDTFGGDSFFLDGRTLKHFQVNALGPFMVTAIIEEDFTCSPA